MCRTLNSDIVTQSNKLSEQLSTHDTSIKSLLNNRGCIKSVQVVSVAFKQGESAAKVLNISAVNINKTILLTDVRGNTESFYAIARLASDTTINVSVNGYLYNSSYANSGYELCIDGTVQVQVVEFY